MKIALIGSGNIANVHARELKNLGLTIEVVIDRQLEKVKDFAADWAIEHASDDVQDAFQTGIDVVHICTPPSSHFELIKQAIEHEIHVVCEKPLTLNAKESAELIDLAKDTDVKVAINFNVRYHAGLQKMQESIQKKDFGAVRFIHASYFQQFHILPTEYNWRYESNVSGNMRAISEIGSHVIDTITYLTGQEITSVSAVTKNYVPTRYMKDSIMYEEEVADSILIQVESEDTALISFRLENGAIGNISLSEISHGKTNEIKIHIDGAYESTWWNNETPYHVYTATKEKGLKMEIDSFGGGYVDTFSSFFAEVYEDIKDHTKGSNYPTLKDGHYNVVVCEAILKSANQHSSWIEI